MNRADTRLSNSTRGGGTTGAQLLLGALLPLLIVLVAAPAAKAQRSTPVQLLHPSAAADDHFGQSVAIDGDTMVVGAPLDDVAEPDQGSAHVYRWTGSGWAFESTLTALATTDQSDQFGYSVAICGDTIVVGCPQTPGGDAYVFVRTGTTWTQTARLHALDDNTQANAGTSVAIWGDTIVTGAPGLQEPNGAVTFRGGAHVFVRTPGSAAWTQQATLRASDGAGGEEMGHSVSIWQDTILVGVPYQDGPGTQDSGAAYVFTRTGGTWTQQAKLTSSTPRVNGDLGQSVAVLGDIAVVGAHGSVFGNSTGTASIFTRSGTAWVQAQELTPNVPNNGSNNYFGGSVAIGGDAGQTILVGMEGRDAPTGGDNNQGAAFVFTRPTASGPWVQQAMLTAPDGAAGDHFGVAVALSGDTAVCGAHLVDAPLNAQGAVWVLSRVGGKWIGPDSAVANPTGGINDGFGYSIAVSGNFAIVGAPFSANERGSAYVFQHHADGWSLFWTLTPSDGTAGDHFGMSVAISDFDAVVGAPDKSTVAGHPVPGVVYAYQFGVLSAELGIDGLHGGAGDCFGRSVGLSGDRLIVGADRAFNGRGTAYLFQRDAAGIWQDQREWYGPTPGPSGFGSSVAIDGDRFVVGAYGAIVGTVANRGRVFAYSQSAGIWTEAELDPNESLLCQYFGHSVAISGNTIVAGATRYAAGPLGPPQDAVGYVFVPSGPNWVQQDTLLPADPQASALATVAISGDLAFLGGNSWGIGPAVWMFSRTSGDWARSAILRAPGQSIATTGEYVLSGAPDALGPGTTLSCDLLESLPTLDYINAHNDTTDRNYSSLSDAFTDALTGQQITAPEGAWRGISSLNTLNRTLALVGSGDVRTPPGSSLSLGSDSSLSTATGCDAVIDGQLQVQAGSNAIFARSFILGSRGSLDLLTDSGFNIVAPSALLAGPVNLASGSFLGFTGTTTLFGPVTLTNATLYSQGTIANYDTLTMTSGQMNTPLFWNRSLADITGPTNGNGSYVNEFGAVTSFRGLFHVFGSFVNNGTLDGQVCNGCDSTPTLFVENAFVLAPSSSLTMPAGGLVRVTADVDCNINSNTRFVMAQATVQLEGTGAEQTLEVMSRDTGPDASGLDPTLSGHFPIGTLSIGPNASTVRLVDMRDNDGFGQSSAEALYVDHLVISPGCRLNNTACRVYYNTLSGNGTVDVPSNLVPIGSTPCYANCDNSTIQPCLNVNDFMCFMRAFARGDAYANCDGSSVSPVLTANDFQCFLNSFFQGCSSCGPH